MNVCTEIGKHRKKTTDLLYKLEPRDDNSNASAFHANGWTSVETLGELVKDTAATAGYL
jgi:hypothetical protein